MTISTQYCAADRRRERLAHAGGGAMKIWLGTHQPAWLARYDAPMMISRRAIIRYKTLPRARGPVMRDSGGFTQLQQFGSWDNAPPEQFVSEARAHRDAIGTIVSFAPRDWMCEPIIISGGWAGGLYFVGTKLSIAEHQRRTVADFLDLTSRAPDLPWLPVLQGWTMDDYLRCAELYVCAGIDLSAQPLVGVGTICRRQGTRAAAEILRRLSAEGLRLHAFGLKGTGIPNVAPFLTSSDSLAWSFAARRRPPLPECRAERARTGRGHKNCANCARYAFRWLAGVERLIEQHQARPYQHAMAF